MSLIETSVWNDVGSSSLDAIQGLANMFGLGDSLKEWIRKGQGTVDPNTAAAKLASMMSEVTTSYNASMSSIESKLNELSGVVASPTIKSILDKAKKNLEAKKTKIQSSYDNASKAYNVGSAATSAISNASAGSLAQKGSQYNKSVETSLNQMSEISSQMKGEVK